MKINKYIGGLALGIGLSLISANPSLANSLTIDNQIQIIESKENDSLSNLDKASMSELEAYDKLYKLYTDNRALFDKSYKLEDLENLASDFGKERKTYYDLLKDLEILKNLDPNSYDLIKDETYEIINTGNVDKVLDQSAKIKKAREEASKNLSEEDLESLVKIDSKIEKSIEEEVDGLLDDGLLINISDYKNPNNLNLFLSSVNQSKNYYLASEKEKLNFDKILKETSENYLKNKDIEESYKLLEDFVKSPDKENFKSESKIEDNNLENSIFTASKDAEITDNQEIILDDDSKDLENKDSLSESSHKEDQSAFLKNDKVSSKYKELSDPQKRELDAMDTNKDGLISDDELDSSANYTSNLGSDSWIYPFTEKSQEESSQDDSNKESQSENEATPTTENTFDNEDENKSEQNKDLPQTVTIDDKPTKSPELNADKEKKENSTPPTENVEEKEEVKEKTQANTSAASVVKTGIKSLWLVGLILVVAIIVYAIMAKNKKK